ncbi:YeeE/YedE family protein [Microbacterium enclense]|uniref:YeeE/YedE family protein n=1 Tax=Microbacterium enclense TaxID=993073 RepID=UPI003444823C
MTGTALGILFERGRFCFFCIFRDLSEKGNSRGAYSILIALAVGLVGYAIVFALRVPVPVPGTAAPGAHVGPVSVVLVIAGLAFGFGIVILGGCIGGHLYRLGEGSLRALPALAGSVIGFGLGFLTWNPLASTFILGAPTPWLPAAAGYAVAVAFQLAVLVAIGIWLLRWNPPVEARPAYRVDAGEIRRVVFFRRWPALLTGALVGLASVLYYLRVGPLGVTSQLSSLTRTALENNGLMPDTLIGLDASLGGCIAFVVETITENGWLIVGIVAGSLAAALPGRRFRLERLSVRGTGTAVLGGILLGWGAIFGLGCTIGVFLSGIQASSASGWIFAASVVFALGLGFRAGLHRGT